MTNSIKCYKMTSLSHTILKNESDNTIKKEMKDMKKEEELKKELKIDTLDIAIEAKKLSLEDKERLYFMIKGMQLSKEMEEIERVMQRA